MPLFILTTLLLFSSQKVSSFLSSSYNSPFFRIQRGYIHHGTRNINHVFSSSPSSSSPSLTTAREKNENTCHHRHSNDSKDDQNTVNTIRSKCQSSMDIYQVLKQDWLTNQHDKIDDFTTTTNNNDYNDLAIIIANTDINIAAAALRRLVDFGNRDDNEDNAAKQQIMAALIAKIKIIVHNDDSSYIMTPNTIVDVLYSLAKLYNQQYSIIFQEEKEMIMLVHELCHLAVSYNNESTDSLKNGNNDIIPFVQKLGTKKLVSITSSLSTLLQNNSYYPQDYDNNPSSISTMFNSIHNRLIQGDALATLSPHETSTLLNSYASSSSLFFQNNLKGGTMKMIMTLCKRLRKEKVRKGVKLNQVVKIVWSLGRIVFNLQKEELSTTVFLYPDERADNGENDDNEENEEMMETLLTEAKMTSRTLLREKLLLPSKENVTETTNTKSTLRFNQIKDIATAYVALDIMQPQYGLNNDNDKAIVRTLAQQLCQSNVISQCNQCRDVSHLLWCFQTLHYGLDDDDSSENEKEGEIIIDKYQVVQRLSQRFHELVLHSAQGQEDNEDDNGCCDPRILTTALKSALRIVPGTNQEEEIYQLLNAASLLLLGQKQQHDGDDNHHNNKFYKNRSKSNNFLSKCNAYELSNIAWCFAISGRQRRRNSNESSIILAVLTDRMLQRDIMDTCSPSSASRFLWSFTTMLSLDGYYDSGVGEYEECYIADDGDGGARFDNDDAKVTNYVDMQERQCELFHKVGGILLSSQLTPVDASCAMWAMAKASYGADMGIFDHLAEVLSAGLMCDDEYEDDGFGKTVPSARQISQALWACGRMVAFEDPLRDKIEFGSEMPPPYLRYAKKYALFLLSSEDLSPKDVAQSIWALGRLKISDDDILEPLGEIAVKISSSFNSQEIANIMWGLGTLGFDRGDIVTVLVDRITTSPLKNDCSSQEAANIMYALGRMKIHDKDAFDCLSSIMMEKLSDATPQGIANALWAHEAVKISPPRGLLDCWAEKKLGIVGLMLKRDDEEEK